MNSLHDLDAFGVLARELADVAIATFRAHTTGVSITIKADGSPVTQIDQAVEMAVRQHIKSRAPAHGIVGEEYGAEGEDRDWVWIIDPIDGTRQFAAGLPNFGILIALGFQGEPVIGIIAQPMIGLVCIGVSVRGTTINGAPVKCAPTQSMAAAIACLSDPDAFDEATVQGFEAVRRRSRWNVYDGGCLGYAALAQGRLGLCLNGPNLEPFDIAALVPVVEGAGGCITDWQGNRLNTASSGAIVASATPALHGELLLLLEHATMS